MQETVSLWGLLLRAAQDHPGNGFIFWEDGIDNPTCVFTYRQLYEQALVRLSAQDTLLSRRAMAC